jgi:CRP/FNR family transcriptional regulator, dissimilatory nitrate respiration regulator
VSSLATIARSLLQHQPEVVRLPAVRRATLLFSQGQIADSVYLIEDGLIKLTRTNNHRGRIILNIAGQDHAVGEESLSEDSGSTYYADAEALTPSTVLRIPREALRNAVAANSELALSLIGAVIDQKRVLAEKVELLCLHDVEYRILHYLAELSALLKPSSEIEGYQLPITQLDLADLIGATRETTSTTLNQLERRGLIRLSRRLLTIPSPSSLRDAATSRNGRLASDSAASAAATNII